MGMRVLLVGPHAWLSRLSNSSLSQPPFELCMLSDVVQAAALAREDAPAAVILFVNGKQTDAVDCCLEVRRAGDFPVIVVADGHAPELVIEMLEAGADDFVSVNVTPSELRARVRAHLRRVVQYAQSHQSVVRLGQIEIHRDRYEVRAADSQVCLAPKEFALLEYLAANAERVVRREELLEHVWHLPQGLKSRTLDVHMSRLREKIAQGGMPVEIATVAGVGYRLRFL